MPITTPDRAVEAARFFGEHTGPLASLAAGTVPRCFGRLRIRLTDLRTDALATSAMLGLSDDPDDPLEELGRQELAEITSHAADLNAWVQSRQCQADVCECRADRLLRALLEDELIDVQSATAQPTGAACGARSRSWPDTAPRPPRESVRRTS